MSSTPMDLSIIIVNWNSKEYLRKCIASILAETHGIEFEIVVIDNASFDGCDQMLRETYPQVRFIQSEKNLGFAKANNAAFHESRGRHVLFLNPDTELVGPAINILLDFLKKSPNAGVVGCKILNADKTVQTSCIQAFPTILSLFLDSNLLRTLWPKSPLWGTAPLFGERNLSEEVEAVSGACLMMKRGVFNQVGLFSEDYFMYTEDIDLSHKVHKQGYRNYYISDAMIIHYGGGSSGKVVSNFSLIMTRESTDHFIRKTRGNLYGYCCRTAILLSALFRITILIMLFPVVFVLRRSSPWSNSLRKWGAIVIWCLNREAWFKKYGYEIVRGEAPAQGSNIR